MRMLTYVFYHRLRQHRVNRPSQREMANFDPSQNQPMSRLQQNSAQLISPRKDPLKPNLIQIHPLGVSGHMGEV